LNGNAEASAGDEGGAGGEGAQGGEGEAAGGGETQASGDTSPGAEPPSRKERIAGIDGKLAAEKSRLATERALAEERQKRKELEATLQGTDVLAFARARGMTKDQAIDALLDANDTAAAAGHAAPDPMKAINDRVANLEAREREVTRREAQSIVERVTSDMDIPVTRATKRVAVQGEDGRTEMMSGLELVTATARRLWEQAGSPDGGVASFLKEAAEKVEDTLINDQREVLEAYAAKKTAGGKAPPAAPKRPAPPAVGRRTGAGGGPSTAPEPIKLSDDQDERQRQIKARFGWT